MKQDKEELIMVFKYLLNMIDNAPFELSQEQEEMRQKAHKILEQLKKDPS